MSSANSAAQNLPTCVCAILCTCANVSPRQKSICGTAYGRKRTNWLNQFINIFPLAVSESTHFLKIQQKLINKIKQLCQSDGEKQYVIIVLICISMISVEIEHRFVCLYLLAHVYCFLCKSSVHKLFPFLLYCQPFSYYSVKQSFVSYVTNTFFESVLLIF